MGLVMEVSHSIVVLDFPDRVKMIREFIKTLDSKELYNNKKNKFVDSIVFTGPFPLHVMILVFMYGALGVSWNIIGGYAGMFSFGQAAVFFADYARSVAYHSRCASSRASRLSRTRVAPSVDENRKSRTARWSVSAAKKSRFTDFTIRCALWVPNSELSDARTTCGSAP